MGTLSEEASITGRERTFTPQQPLSRQQELRVACSGQNLDLWFRMVDADSSRLGGADLATICILRGAMGMRNWLISRPAHPRATSTRR